MEISAKVSEQSRLNSDTYIIVSRWVSGLGVSGVFSGQNHGQQSCENDALEEIRKFEESYNVIEFVDYFSATFMFDDCWTSASKLMNRNR